MAKRGNRMTALAALALAALPGGAMAATVTLDLASLGSFTLAAGQSETVTIGGSVTTVGNVTTTVSGLTLTILGRSVSGSSLPTSNAGGTRHISGLTTTGFFANDFASALTFNGSGAGVTNSREGILGFGSDGPTADTSGGYADYFEILVSGTGTGTATLTGAGFTEYSFNGGGKSRSNFVWASDTNNDGGVGNGDAISQAIKLSSAGSVTFGATSDAFLIGASGSGSSFRLASLSFDYTPTVTMVSAVPLPASGLALLGGLAGLGALKRRRRSA